MAKRIQVGGRIESKEVGGIVTGAAEILDDAKEKKQSVINQETDDELLRLDQSKQDNLTFDNAPTEGSNNPVKSGGLYTAQQAILLAIAAINELIPSAASVLNQLADKAFVNSSISTNTATFRGTSAAGLNEQQFLAWANGLEHDLNDYVFWQTSDAAGNTLFKRYKWNGTEWAYEYTLNNSTFTAEQWEAIQSGITALLVAKLRALPTAQELIQSFDGKQDVLTFDNVPTLGSTNPVKSSGIYNAIDGEKTRAEGAEQGLSDLIDTIQALIPAEATAQNQLADKADVAAKIVAAIPSWKGQYDALTDLQAVTGAKAGDMGCVKTTDSDGHAVLTFYQYSAQGAWVVYYTLRHYAQNKPATTGTTGDYPYNGMGRIELQKNIVNGVNTLTQAMLTQQNTVYVIQYDFTLGDDITVPANCVLEFDGGSVNCSNYVITGDKMPTNVVYTPEMFGAGKTSDDTKAIQSCFNMARNVKMNGEYNVYANTTNFGNSSIVVVSNTNIEINGEIYYKTTNLDTYSILLIKDVQNVKLSGSGILIGDKEIHSGTTGEWGHGISIISSVNIEICGDLELYNFWGDGIYLGYIAPQNNNVKIEGVYIHDCRRNGVSVTGGNNVEICNFKITNIAGISPQTGIDIENQTSDDISGINNVHIHDGVFEDCASNSIKFMGGKANNVRISNLDFDASVILRDSAIISNCRLTKGGTISFEGPCSIFNCSGFYMNWFNPGDGNTVNISNCTILSARDSGNNSKGNLVIDNSILNIAATSGSDTLRINGGVNLLVNNSNIDIQGVDSLSIKNIVFNNCKISFKDVCAYFLYKAYKCIINVGLEGEGSHIFDNYDLLLSNCLVNILGDRNIPLFRLNLSTNKLKAYDCAFIDVIERTKIYNNLNPERLVDTESVYIIDSAS